MPKTNRTDDVPSKLKELEESIDKVKGGYAELGQYMDVLREISSRYFRLMDLYTKHGRISVDLAAPDVNDQISKDIIRILLDMADKDRQGSNLSEITRELKNARGSASRRIVREKVAKLEKMGHIKKVGGGKIPTYAISDSLVEKWYSLLGMSKG